MAFEKGRAARAAVDAREAAAVESVAESLTPETAEIEEIPAVVAQPAAAALDPVSAALIRIQEQNAENTRRQLEIAEQQLAFQKQTLDEDRRVRPRENAVDPGISAFSYPEGEKRRPKPKLTRETFCNHVKQNEDVLTPAEIEAFNAFSVNCSARKGVWTVRIEQNGTTERLFVDFPCKTPDDRMNLPQGLRLILAELQGGPAAVDVGTRAAEVAALRAQLAAHSAA